MTTGWVPIPQINTSTGAATSLPAGAINTINPLAASYNTLKSGYVDPRDWTGWDPTGVNPVDSYLNAAIVQAIANKLPLRIPPGIFSIANTIQCANNPYDRVQIVGAGCGLATAYSSAPTLPMAGSTVFVPTFTNRPAFSVSGGWGTYLKDFAIVGLNFQPALTANSQSFGGYPQIYTDVKANYITSGCRDSQYSPYCGLGIDLFAGVTPPDGGYPGMTSVYSSSAGASSACLYENIMVSGFTVGIIQGVLGGLSDSQTFRNCCSISCDTAWATCSTQAKVAQIYGGQYYGRTCFDGVSYGTTSSGCPPLIVGSEIGGYRLLNFSDQYGPMRLEKTYSEGLQKIGNWGATNIGSAQGDALVLASCSFYLQAGNAGALPPIPLQTTGPCRIEGCTLQMGPPYVFFALNLVAQDTPIDVANCGISQMNGNNGQMGFIGWNQNGTDGIMARLSNCRTTQGGSAYPNVADDIGGSLPLLTVPPGGGTNPRYSPNGRPAIVYQGQAMYQYQPPNATSLYSTTVSALTMNTTAITFTGGLSGGATSGTLTGNWAGITGIYNVTFSDAEVRQCYLQNGSTAVNWFGNGLTGAVTSSATVGNTSVTFTASAGVAATLQVGDLFLWKMLPQGWNSSQPIQHTVPGLQIKTVTGGGGTVTCNLLWQATEYDTVANQASSTTLLLPQIQWAPTAPLTATMNNSTAITVVSPTTILQNGDWVTDGGTHIPAGTRVVSGGGTASITLSQATTGGSVSGIVLYSGRLAPLSLGTPLA